MEPNALAVTNAADILSLINLSGASSIVSTNSSTSFSQDFNALLSEMTGPGAIEQGFAPEANRQVAVPGIPMLPGATASSIPTPPAGSDTESLNELAPEARKNLAPAVRPGTKPAAAQGPEGRKINATNLTPLRGFHYDVYDSPGLPPGLGSNGPPGLSVEDPPSEDPSAAHLIGQVPKPQLPESPATTTKAIPSDSSALPLFAGFHFAVLSAPSVAAVADKNPAKVVEQPVAPLPVSRETHPELERAFADVTKFELTVQPEVSAASLARGEQRTAIPQDSPSKLAIVTTDAVANVLQQQLPPRVVPVLRVVPEQKPADRSKANPGSTADLASPSPACHINDLVRPAERIDQPPAAHTIEIPNLPRLPVVRTVAMQVGEAGSEVSVRIQQRSSGEVTLQLNASSEKLQQNLQSSVASLAQALKLENVSVSGIEVSRKSPADKVRRMKETH